jgi:hypothetical protein
MHVSRFLLFGLVLTICSGCGRATPRRASAPPPPAAAKTSRPDSVDWGSVTLPGSVCGASKPIRLHGGRAFVSPIPHRFAHALFYGKRGVTVDAAPEAVVYGHLDTTSNDAGLNVNCNNGGGTADGNLLWSWVIFAVHGGKPSVVGILTPQVQLPHELPTLLEIVIEHRTIVVHEAFYGPHDGTCCSSGRATTIWTYTSGHLRPGHPAITAHPRRIRVPLVP